MNTTVKTFAALLGCIALASAGCSSSGTEVPESPEAGETESAQSGVAACAQAPLALTVVAPRAAITTAQQAFNAAQAHGGSWRSVNRVALYRYKRCAKPAPSLDVLEGSLPSDTAQSIHMLRVTELLDRTGIEADTFLSGPAGTPLLQAIDSWAGTSATAGSLGVRHWDEVPCHNCTDHVGITILHDPKTRKVVVIEGNYGWDS